MQVSAPRSEEFQIDSDEAAEIAPTLYRVEGEIGLFRRTADGGTQGVLAALPPPPLLILEKYHSLQLIERQSNLPLFDWNGEVVVESESWSLAAKGGMVGAVKFRASRWANEALLNVLS